LPLGSGALAGTTFPIDREMVARELGFDWVSANSLDAVGDRDFAIELLAAGAILGMHLSRFSEEIVLWSSQEFAFIDLPDSFATGSSMMPQKKNPDIAELIRGKTGRLNGNLMNLLTVLKGLPLAYNRDLQEDKERLFDSVDTVAACLELAAAVVDGAELNREAIAARLDKGYLDATTLMEHLIMRGVPQRTAHEIIGRLVATAMKRGVPLAELPLEEFQTAHASLDKSVYDILGVDRAIAAFTSYGSTNPGQVDHQLTLWRDRLSDTT
jgi:argininosuccinate lyase